MNFTKKFRSMVNRNSIRKYSFPVLRYTWTVTIELFSTSARIKDFLRSFRNAGHDYDGKDNITDTVSVSRASEESSECTVHAIF